MTRLGSVPLIALTGLSTNSQHLFTEKSGHGVQQDEPAAAVSAIVKMVQQVRAAASR